MRSRPCILIIDDNHSLVTVVGRILQKEGYDVVTAFDGNEGLKKIREENPDLIVLDLLMPGISGFQILDYLRERSDVPVVVMTGVTDAPTLRNVLDHGADDCITKPFYASPLITMIKARLPTTSPVAIG